jgi:hypothetical protein
VDRNGCGGNVPCYGPLGPNYYNPAAYNDLQQLSVINARFIGRVAGLWEGEYAIKPEANASGTGIGYMEAARRTVTAINAAYSTRDKPIIQAAIFEIVTDNVNNIDINQTVIDAFSGAMPRKFNVHAMAYPEGSDTTNPDPELRAPPSGTQIFYNGNRGRVVPNMARVETQMWFYYLATQYIDAGFEAIHLGQINLMDKTDPGHHAWWSLLSKIRAYAAVHARRHVVLLDAHTPPEPELIPYYDPDPTNPVSSGRQLLFDFHSFPLRILEDRSKPWGPPAGGGATLTSTNGGALYSRPLGGHTYFGWDTPNLPFIVEFDNYGNTTNGSASYDEFFPWGWDEITWFSFQTNTYRNQWLKYAYYQVQCLSQQAQGKGYLQMPFIRNFSIVSNTIYRASNGPVDQGHFNQQDMIMRLWNGEYDKEWAFHDISQHIINSPPHTPNVAGNSVSIGENAYYIGIDGRIYTYNRNGASWQTTSPTWAADAAGQPDRNQVKAARDLVASPDGKYLYYRGVDGEVYGFEVITPWRYRYFKLNANSLQDAEKVASDLICAGNNRLYYRSKSNRIYAYILHQGVWTPTSPSWAANSNTPIGNQLSATGGLVVNPSLNRLYYRGSDNFLHGFSIDSDWEYHYFNLPQQNLAAGERVGGSLVCVKDKQIFYVGLDSWVHGLLLNDANGAPSSNVYGGIWGKISPTYAAQLTPNGVHEQTKVLGSLAASPSPGDTPTYLAYIGTDSNLHGYRVLDDYSSEYFNFPAYYVGNRPTSDVRFKSSTELFYVSNYYEGGYDPEGNYYSTSNAKLNLLQLSTQLAACYNPAIALIENPYTASRLAAPATTQAVQQRSAATAASDAEVAAYPNPATRTLQVAVTSRQFVATTAQLRDLYGKKIREVAVSREGDASVGTATISVQDVATGIYLLVVTDKQGRAKTSKVAIQH